MSSAICAQCGDPIWPHPTDEFHLAGWSHHRGGKGAELHTATPLSYPHMHQFAMRWRCEHLDSNHSAVCQRGRWVHVCNCGEPGFEKRGGGPDNERSAGGDGRLGEGNSDTEGGHGEGTTPASVERVHGGIGLD